MMMQYTLKSGRVVTDAQIEEMAKAAELGEYPGAPIGEVIIGRPRIFTEGSKTLSFKAPETLDRFICDAAAKAGESKSAFLRAAAYERAERILA